MTFIRYSAYLEPDLPIFFINFALVKIHIQIATHLVSHSFFSRVGGRRRNILQWTTTLYFSLLWYSVYVYGFNCYKETSLNLEQGPCLGPLPRGYDDLFLSLRRVHGVTLFLLHRGHAILTRHPQVGFILSVQKKNHFLLILEEHVETEQTLPDLT